MTHAPVEGLNPEGQIGFGYSLRQESGDLLVHTVGHLRSLCNTRDLILRLYHAHAPDQRKNINQFRVRKKPLVTEIECSRKDIHLQTEPFGAFPCVFPDKFREVRKTGEEND